jgi:hypothetical protein
VHTPPSMQAFIVATLALGSRPRQEVAKLGQEGDSGVTSHALGSVRGLKEWTFTLQVSSHYGSWSPKWTLESSERDLRGQNPLVGKVIYIIGNLLKRRCLKWARITHLDIWNLSYDQKKGKKSNWQFDSRSLKVKNRPNFLAYGWRAAYRWKDLNESYNFASELITIEGLHAKLWASKAVGVPTIGILGLPRQKKGHLDVAPMERCKVYMERWWLSPSPGRGESCESKLPVANPSTKSVLTMH